jgi:hypothetical protein
MLLIKFFVVYHFINIWSLFKIKIPFYKFNFQQNKFNHNWIFWLALNNQFILFKSLTRFLMKIISQSFQVSFKILETFVSLVIFSKYQSKMEILFTNFIIHIKNKNILFLNHFVIFIYIHPFLNFKLFF